MTSHEFAKLLLGQPDLVLFALDVIGPQEVNSPPRVYVITQEDEDICGSCNGRVGDEVIGFYI